MTTAPALKAALLEALDERVGLSGVHLAWGLPAELPDAYERVYIVNASGFRREATRGSVVYESYDLNLAIEVDRNDSQQAVDERMREIEAEVEAAVNDGLGVAFVTGFAAGDDEMVAGTNSWVARCHPKIAVKAVK